MSKTVCISTYFSCSEEELWSKIASPKSLQYVAAPILRFVPCRTDSFSDEWQEGPIYDLNLYLFHVIPLGRHRIKILKADKKANTIVSKESGLFAPVWNHTISFHQCGSREVSYKDRIEIEAGLLTPLICIFARFFYRHRQRRWKRLLTG